MAVFVEQEKLVAALSLSRFFIGCCDISINVIHRNVLLTRLSLMFAPGLIFVERMSSNSSVVNV